MACALIYFSILHLIFMPKKNPTTSKIPADDGRLSEDGSIQCQYSVNIREDGRYIRKYHETTKYTAAEAG